MTEPKRRWLAGGKYKVREVHERLLRAAVRRHRNKDYEGDPARWRRMSRVLSAAKRFDNQLRRTWVLKYVAKWEAQDQKQDAAQTNEE